MNPPILYDSVFPYLHLSLEDIDVDHVELIPQWIEDLVLRHPQTFHQINVDASHPLVHEIVTRLITCIPNDNRLSYIRIRQSRKTDYLTKSLLQTLMKSVRENENNPNITVHVKKPNKVAYY
jgi:hypothetical protein